MSETTPSTPPTSGRVRRRASRQAGPVGDSDRTAAEVTVVPTGSTANSSAVQTSATEAATSSVAVPVDAPETDTAGVDTVKYAAAEADSTVKLDSAGHPDASGAEPVDAPVDEPVDALGSQSEVVSEKRGFRRSMRPLEWVAAAVAVVAVLGLLGSGGAYFYHQSHADALASQRAEYIQTAKQAILNLTNIKDDTASQDIDRVLSVASGDLKAEYSQRKDAYAQVVKQAKVKASGEVIEAAIESQKDDSAEVLVAAKQTLTNAGDAQPQDRYYRFRVTVNRGDGGVTASKVEFVA